MKKYVFFFFYLWSSCFGFAQSDASLLSTASVFWMPGLIEKHIPENSHFELGLQQFARLEYHEAIRSWKQGLTEAKKAKDSLLMAKFYTNLGVAFTTLGFHKMALPQFLKATTLFQATRQFTLDYWLNHVNTGVSYMALGEYALAKDYFDTTPTPNATFEFVKEVNQAHWAALQNQPALFLAKQSKLNTSAAAFPTLNARWLGIQLQFFIHWKNELKIKEVIEQLNKESLTNHLPLRLLVNQGYLVLYQRLFDPISAVLSLAKTIENNGPLFLKAMYYRLLQEYYYRQKDIDKMYQYAQLLDATTLAITSQKNKFYVNESIASIDLAVMKKNFSEEASRNQDVQKQLVKSNSLFRFSILLLVLVCVVIVLLGINYRKRKKLHVLEVLQVQQALAAKEHEKEVLFENLRETANKLDSSSLHLKKIALLKKQLETIIQDKKTGGNEKETLQQLKLCLNSFFDTYRELNTLVYPKPQGDKRMDHAKLNSANLTQSELQVIDLIALQYTTKEMAILLGKSEKSIEYYRAQIRKKIQTHQ